MRPQLCGLWLVCCLATPFKTQGEDTSRVSPSAEELLRAADRARGGMNDGIRWTIQIDSVVDEQRQERSYLVKAFGVDALAEALAPPRNKGEIYLFNDRNLWFIKPGLRKPVSISPRQRLSGDASNGDIASTNYARDYEGEVIGEDDVQGERCYLLRLKSRAKNATYDKIHYWVSASRRLGVKAEFRTVSDSVFKTATFEYGNKLQTGSGEIDFVQRMIIRDPNKPNSVTTIRFSQPRIEHMASSAFNINNVAR